MQNLDLDDLADLKIKFINILGLVLVGRFHLDHSAVSQG
jgi:hypothetical protein